MPLTTAPLKVKITREDGTSGKRVTDCYGADVGIGVGLSCYYEARLWYSGKIGKSTARSIIHDTAV